MGVSTWMMPMQQVIQRNISLTSAVLFWLKKGGPLQSRFTVVHTDGRDYWGTHSKVDATLLKRVVELINEHHRSYISNPGRRAL